MNGFILCLLGLLMNYAACQIIGVTPVTGDKRKFDKETNLTNLTDDVANVTTGSDRLDKPTTKNAKWIVPLKPICYPQDTEDIEPRFVLKQINKTKDWRSSEITNGAQCDYHLLKLCQPLAKHPVYTGSTCITFYNQFGVAGRCLAVVKLAPTTSLPSMCVIDSMLAIHL